MEPFDFEKNISHCDKGEVHHFCQVQGNAILLPLRLRKQNYRHMLLLNTNMKSYNMDKLEVMLDLTVTLKGYRQDYLWTLHPCMYATFQFCGQAGFSAVLAVFIIVWDLLFR